MSKLGIHGTRYTYDKARCRCLECREANRVYIREYFQRPHNRERQTLKQRERYARKKAQRE